MSDIKDILNRRGLANLGLMTGSQLQRERAQLDEQRRAGDFEIDKCVQGEVIGDDDHHFYLVRTDYPLETIHGPLPLGAVLDAIPEHVALSACDSALDTFDPSTTVFVDTETTGLAGGTGTVAFLVGVGYFVEGAFRLDQCFMRDFDEEEPMLHFLDDLFKRAETVVSFNGKSFDVPLLRTRFISNRVPFRLDSAAHFDLVHAARRIWKLRLKDCSLGNVERTVLHLQRHGDVPSAEIPQIWMDYLHTRDARELTRVFYHHRTDVLSLVTLTALVSQCLDTPHGEGFEYAEDRLSLIRLHFRQKHFEDAASCAIKLLEIETEPYIRRECLELLALSSKRLQDWARMEESWDLMRREFPSNLFPTLELVKHHEHRSRNLPEALRLCEEAVHLLETRVALGRADDADLLQIEGLQRRLERIRRKLSKGRRGEDSG